MGENNTGFLTDHQQKCLWDLMIPFNIREGQIFHFQMLNQIIFCHKHRCLGEQCFLQPHHPLEPERIVPSEDREVTFAKSPAGFCSV